MIDTLKEIWQTLSTNRLRTLLTGMSVAWGIFMLILLLGIANGVINAATEGANKNDPYRVTVWGGVTTLPFHGLKEGRQIDLQQRDIDALAAAEDSRISGVTGSISLQGKVSTSRDYLANGSCDGVFPKRFNHQFKIVAGRAINEADIKAKRKVIMLSNKSLPTLFADTLDAVGRMVNVGDYAFKLIGVYEHPWEQTSYVPYTTAYALNGYKGTLSSIDVNFSQVSNDQESGEIEQATIEILAKTEQFDVADEGAVYTYDRFASYLEQQKALGILSYAMWAIGLLTLITGIVGVSNIMFVSVRERTHEIGVRRAIGAKPRNILTQVVLESVVLTTAFGYIGIVMGTLVTELVKKAFATSDFLQNPTVDIVIAIEVTVALIIAGAIAGIFPAMRALKIKPVEALRDE